MEDARLCNKSVNQDTMTLETKPTQLPHLSVPSHNNHNGHNGQRYHDGHRIWRSSTIGYIAPNFEGKKAQMAEGQYTRIIT
jgi:glutamate dehydrogenase